MVKQSELEKDSSVLLITYELVTGLVEFFLGFAILFYGQDLLILYHKLIFSNFFIFEHESLASILESIIPYLFEHYIYVAILFVSLGIIKLICGIGLYYQKRWASDVLILALVLLMPLDIISILQHFTIYKLFYLIFNSLIVYYLVNRKT